MKKRLTSKKLERFAKQIGVDLFGIANIERFEDAPDEHNPICHHGALKKVSPFTDVDIPEAGGLYDAKILENPYYAGHNKLTDHIAICGARSCIRACMIHLEEKGKLENTFELPFRRRKPWDM